MYFITWFIQEEQNIRAIVFKTIHILIFSPRVLIWSHHTRISLLSTCV